MRQDEIFANPFESGVRSSSIPLNLRLDICSFCFPIIANLDLFAECLSQRRAAFLLLANFVDDVESEISETKRMAHQLMLISVIDVLMFAGTACGTKHSLIRAKDHKCADRW